MKLKILFVLSALFLSVSSQAQEKKKTAHQHESKHNGKVLTLGDVHFEVVGSDSMLMLYYFDRFGDELATSKIEVSLELVEGTQRQPLKFTKDQKSMNLIHVSLPKVADKASAQIFIKAKNVDLPKGQVVGGTVVKIALKDIGAGSDDPHAGHHM